MQWHWLVLKDTSQNVTDLLCPWDVQKRACASLPILPSSRHSSSTCVFTSEFCIVIELLGSTPFLTPTMFFIPVNSHNFIHFINLHACVLLVVLAPED